MFVSRLGGGQDGTGGWECGLGELGGWDGGLGGLCGWDGGLGGLGGWVLCPW